MDRLWVWEGRNSQIKPLIFGRGDELGAAKHQLLSERDWEENLISIGRGYFLSLH